MNYENITDVTHGATYYHADYVNPGWPLPKTVKIGRHIFYKKKTDHFYKKEFKNMMQEIKNNLTQLIIAVTIVAVSAIVSLAIYHLQ